MSRFALSRWSVVRMARQPGYWLLIGLLTFTWPAIQVLAPLGIGSRHIIDHSFLYEFVFISAWAGSWLGLTMLEGLSEILRRSNRLDRWISEAATILSIGAGTTLLVLLATSISGGFDAAFRVWRLGEHLVLVHLALAGVGLVLLRLRLPRGASPVLFPFLAWILPALSPGAGRLAAPGSLLSFSPDPLLPDPVRSLEPMFHLGWILALLAVSLLASHHPRRCE